MEKLDGRKLKRKMLAEIRIRVVKQVEAGGSPEIVIKTLGLHLRQIYKWLVLYREGGINALKKYKAKYWEPKLKGHQIRALYRIITSKIRSN